MIVLDTNVLSEHLKRRPDPKVSQWLEANIRDSAITTITVAEMLYGAFNLDDGTRRGDLLEWLDTTFADASSAGRMLDLNQEAAEVLARLRADTRRAGRSLAFEDLAIAAVCKSRSMAVATRNVKHFEGLGIEVIDPWTC